MYLDRYTTGSYTPGAPYWKQLLWYFIGSPLVQSYWLPMSGLKVWLLQQFGAAIGQGVRIKTGVRVKFPWRLTLGDFVWIGEDAWIDNLAQVTIESHVCISQGVYLCTGNHNWSEPDFRLITAPIHIQAGSWIAAKAVIGPGVTVGQGAVLTLGGVTVRSLEPMTIYAGNPAQAIKPRKVSELQPLLPDLSDRMSEERC
ncbi:colanic acid biosynthesis acetyltransferase WcaF [Oculatella sp. LEGE 06141]|nr:putative colanic acid biosynthesis acetyltransferase [Oculatella sp. LEGE 06141]MBE9179533.1 colanic acid biosynthesis acetyltransferase WcaF [Oculatella sp. LEGE 06141]